MKQTKQKGKEENNEEREVRKNDKKKKIQRMKGGMKHDYNKMCTE